MNATKFEKVFVKDVYSSIANHFDKTRYHTWPKIQDFVNSLDTNSHIYDIGCGNGRNMNIRGDCVFVGCDNNEELLIQAEKKGNTCQYGDNLSLPFSDGCADAVMSIAVIHHFSTIDRRIKALSEIFRILKETGSALIYVWAHEQDKFANFSKNALVDWNNQENGEIIKRYYYLFSNGELDTLIKNNFKNITIVESGIQCNNYYVICRKT
tara:strand:+ start:1684 stop:2313 length:630 start_codon:yes stop_codon:yes gene_type:complete